MTINWLLISNCRDRNIMRLDIISITRSKWPGHRHQCITPDRERDHLASYPFMIIIINTFTVCRSICGSLYLISIYTLYISWVTWVRSVKNQKLCQIYLCTSTPIFSARRCQFILWIKLREKYHINIGSKMLC